MATRCPQFSLKKLKNSCLEIPRMNIERTNVEIMGDDNDIVDDDVRADDKAEAIDGKLRKLIVFSGNDYLGLSSHPMVSNAAIKAAQEHGMGPRGSALIFNQIVSIESFQCFSANMAFMTAVGNVGLLVAGGKLSKDDRVAIFSDALNHASIIDGIRLAERQGNAVAFVYRHADMCHLDALLSSCPMKKRVVVTDSLFSMDGFLFVIDDAHATFVLWKKWRWCS
ncbi:hypothetical protein ABFS82_06G048900 [Erythranthe guttata]